MSYVIELDHGFEPGQLYQNIGYKRYLYRSISNIRSRMPATERMQVGQCFLLLEIYDANPLNLEDYDLFFKILFDEKIFWIGFNYQWDCTTFSPKYVDHKSGNY